MTPNIASNLKFHIDNMIALFGTPDDFARIRRRAFASRETLADAEVIMTESPHSKSRQPDSIRFFYASNEKDKSLTFTIAYQDTTAIKLTYGDADTLVHARFIQTGICGNTPDEKNTGESVTENPQKEDIAFLLEGSFDAQYRPHGTFRRQVRPCTSKKPDEKTQNYHHGETSTLKILYALAIGAVRCPSKIFPSQVLRGLFSCEKINSL